MKTTKNREREMCLRVSGIEWRDAEETGEMELEECSSPEEDH